MNSEIKAIRKALQNRKSELLDLITQMKSDQLMQSAVFRNLNRELTHVSEKLDQEGSSGKK